MAYTPGLTKNEERRLGQKSEARLYAVDRARSSPHSEMGVPVLNTDISAKDILGAGWDWFRLLPVVLALVGLLLLNVMRSTQSSTQGGSATQVAAPNGQAAEVFPCCTGGGGNGPQFTIAIAGGSVSSWSCGPVPWGTNLTLSIYGVESHTTYDWVFAQNTPWVGENISFYWTAYGCAGGANGGSVNSNHVLGYEKGGYSVQGVEYSWDPSFTVDGAFGTGDVTTNVNILENIWSNNTAQVEVSVNSSITYSWEGVEFDVITFV
jgi:hypothetical protein